MAVQYLNAVIFVDDVRRSVSFYTEILGQKVIQDYGRYAGFEGGFGVWQRDYAMSIIYPDRINRFAPNGPQTELYFEADVLEATIQVLKDNSVHFIHDIYEHDWGQRGVRVRDPDGIIIEISEPMDAVIRRFFDQGMNAEQIAQKTGMPVSEINHLSRIDS